MYTERFGPAPITTDLVWQEIEKNLFAVLGTVTKRGEPRTVGVVYVVRNRKFYMTAERDSWKVRHIENNHNVSLTVAIPKRVPFLPWIQIPAATITLQGEATLHNPADVPPEILHALLRGLEIASSVMPRLCIIEVAPKGEFLTYGVGVSLLTMRKPEQACGRAPVHTQ